MPFVGCKPSIWMRISWWTGVLILLFSCSGPPEFVSVDYAVMGTSARVIVPREKRPLADSAYREMLRVDSLMSIWKPESELSRLNARGCMRVDSLTLACIRIAILVSSITDGAFDPTVGPLIHAWGFDSDSPHMPDPESIERAKGLVGWERIRIIGDSVVLGKGQSLDLGGVAKGLALDIASAKLQRMGCSDFLVEIGGDMVCCGQKGAEPWLIGIRDPADPGGIMGTMRIRERSLAICTSGDYERFVEIGGMRYSHIMDPRRGEPAEGVLSVTVLSERGAAFTDAITTGLFVLGPQKGLELADSLGIEAMFVYRDGDTIATATTKGFQEVIR
ncbi:MAG: FAD:protein FMN transferase [candidate division WOR-3 bacterium]